MDLARLEINAEDIKQDKPNTWAICVAAEDRIDIETIVRQGNIPNSKIMTSTVGQLRDKGYDVVMTPEDGPARALLLLPVDPSSKPTESDWEKLKDCFHGPVKNPARR